MKRIVIIGPSGAGKTMLAKQLEAIYKIKVYHLDRIFWERGWKGIPPDKRTDILQKIVGERQWIIEGFYLKSSIPRLEAADTIIFLDMPFLLCLHRLYKRHRKQRGLGRRDIPLESTDKFDLKLVFKVLLFTLWNRRLLSRELARYEGTKDIRQFHWPKEVDAFIAEQEKAVGKQTNHASASRKAVRVAEKSHPALLSSP